MITLHVKLDERIKDCASPVMYHNILTPNPRSLRDPRNRTFSLFTLCACSLQKFSFVKYRRSDMEEGRKSSSEQHACQVDARTLDVSQKQAKSLEADRKYLEEVSAFEI